MWYCPYGTVRKQVALALICSFLARLSTRSSFPFPLPFSFFSQICFFSFHPRFSLSEEVSSVCAKCRRPRYSGGLVRLEVLCGWSKCRTVSFLSAPYHFFCAEAIYDPFNRWIATRRSSNETLISNLQNHITVGDQRKYATPENPCCDEPGNAPGRIAARSAIAFVE